MTTTKPCPNKDCINGTISVPIAQNDDSLSGWHNEECPTCLGKGFVEVEKKDLKSILENLMNEPKPKVRQFQERYLITHSAVKEMASYLLRGWPQCCGNMSIEAWIVDFTDDLPKQFGPQGQKNDEAFDKLLDEHFGEGQTPTVAQDLKGGDKQCPAQAVTQVAVERERKEATEALLCMGVECSTLRSQLAQATERADRAEKLNAECLLALRFPALSAGTANAIAYQFEVGKENHSCPVGDVAIAEWLRDIAKQLEELDKARSNP